MGNSEVGHTNMGAGRIVYQELTRITKSIEDGDFFENEALNKAIDNCKEHDSSLHLFGLLSPGGVHSHNTHLYGILELAKRKGLSKVYLHAFLGYLHVSGKTLLEFVGIPSPREWCSVTIIDNASTKVTNSKDTNIYRTLAVIILIIVLRLIIEDSSLRTSISSVILGADN